jgi:excisionase family DNA binding protein
VADDVLIPAEVARLVRLSLKTIYRAIKSGELTASQVRGRYLIRRCDVDRWLREKLVVVSDEVIGSPPSKVSAAGSRLALKRIERAA